MENVILKLVVFFGIIGVSWSFQAGHTYKYSYTTTLRIDKPNQLSISKTKNGTVRLTAVVEISALWDRDGDYVRKLKVLSGHVGMVDSSTHQSIKQITTHPVYFSQKLGGNIVVYRFLDDSIESVNIKQGIVNMLLYQTHPGTLKEVDISGECDAIYGRDGHLVTKMKKNCRPRQLTGQFTNPEKFWSPNTTSSYKMTFDIDDMLTLKSATCEESHVTKIDIDSSLGSVIFQRQELTYLGISSGPQVKAVGLDEAVIDIRKQEGGRLVESLLSSEIERAYCDSKMKTEASAVIARYRDDLYRDNTALPEAANAFLHVVFALRQTSKAAILEILNDPDNFYHVNELVDACVAADTHDAHAALREFLIFDDENEVELPERFLFATAFSTHPSQASILSLKDLVSRGIPNIQVRASTLLALGAVLQTYYKTVDRYTLPFITDVQNWLIHQLNACETNECKIMYLGALRNAALPGALPTVLYYSEHSEVELVSLAALDALSRYNADIMTREAKPVLLRIYNQLEQQQPLAVRVGALDQLLSAHLTPIELRDVITAAQWLPSNESTAYVIRRILDRAVTDEYYRNLISDLKTDKTWFNYNTLAVPGNSTALTNSFIESKDVGSTYSLYIEKTPSGLLQKSITDVIAKSANQNVLPLVKVGIYTDGLDSIASYFGGSDDTTASSEPSAGLRLSLMGVGLRPIQFFSSQGEMMSALWNAPSDPVSALQGNILLHDHVRLLPLGNGMTADVQLQSCLSLDLSGAVSVSLWNRQSESFVRNSGSFHLRGDSHVHSSLFSLGMNFSLESSAEIHFLSEVDFYEMPISMCMQMTMPDYETRVKTTRHATVSEKEPFRKTTSVTYTAEGKSFLLDPRNTQQCNEMEIKKNS